MAAVLALAACGAPTVTPPPFPPAAPRVTAPTEEAAPYRPPTVFDDSRRLYAQATATSDARERCRLLEESSTLDGTNLDARTALSESRCLPARELLDHAKAVWAARPDAKSATTLLAVATRASSKSDVLAAAAALEKSPDLAARLAAARALARLGEHARAAASFDAIATDRAQKGAQLDAIDARLTAIVERARASLPCGDALTAALAELTPATGTYGAAFIELELVDAIAAVRNAGDAASADAAVKQARAKKLFASPASKHALELEEAIGAARKAQSASPLAAFAKEARRSSQIEDPASRALLAVEARLDGKCPAARAHADAHAWSASRTLPRLDDDVAWARACTGGGAAVVTLVAPMPTAEVEDAIAVGAVDPIRARTMLAAWVDRAPDDVPAIVALVSLTRPEDRLVIVESVVARQPMQPALRRARFPLLGERARVDEVHALATSVLPATIEVQDDARAAAVFLATLLGESPSDADAGTRALAEAIVHACASSPATGPCGTPSGALATSMRILRRARATSVVKDAPRLSDDDLADASLRLEAVLALLDRGAVVEAAALAGDKRLRWDGPEANLAKASVGAAQGNCTDASLRIGRVGAIESAYGADVRWVRERCARK